MDIKIMEPSLQNRRKKLRVCAYCGVPAKEAEQINSLDEQIEYYEKLIREKPMYDFAGIYYDSGTYRFQEMMQVARDHQFDLIITKSVSCFCRNTDTLLKAVKELKELGIGIFFEQQKLNTLHLTGDVMLTVLAAFAQEESDRYNESAKDAGSGKCETKKPAKFLNRSFGFRKNAMGEYEPDPEEAPVVRIMFELCVEGYTPTQIATFLNQQGITTKQGIRFLDSTVLWILKNEIYKGDYKTHKQYDKEEWTNVKLVSCQMWEKAQEQLKSNREKRHERSEDGECSFQNQIFCAECGFPLVRRRYSNDHKVAWICYGQKRYKKEFCSGVSVPDTVIRSWGDLPGNIYVRKETDELGKSRFQYVMESSWKQDHQKKEAPEKARVEETFPYQNHLFCRECGSRLVKCVLTNGHVFWVCNKSKRKGKAVCPGVRVPDEVVQGFGQIRKDVYIERKDHWNGAKSYSYSSKERQTNRKTRKQGQEEQSPRCRLL